MSVKNEKFDGSVIIGRDLTLGGGVVTKGSSTFEKNLRVEGWLDAPNLRGACKGLFATEEKLNDMYPNPEDGMWAMVGETIPAYVYMAENGEWVDTGNLTDGIDINLNDTEIVVNLDELRDNISALETAMDNLREEQQRADNQIKADLNIETNQRINKDTELKDAIDNVIAKIEVPNLAEARFGYADDSQTALTIFNTFVPFVANKKPILLVDALNRMAIPVIYQYDSDGFCIHYSFIDESYNTISCVKEICVDGIYDLQTANTTFAALEFSDAYTSASSLKGTYTGNDDIVFFNTTTNRFCSVVVQSGVMPQFYGNSPKLAKYGVSTANGKIPYEGVLYYTGSNIFVWNGNNLVKLS